MKKIIFGIFAHPDDEAFGPSGTLMKEIDQGADVHLITLTTGQAGMNPDNHPDLGVVREQEWRAAGELIGATSMHALGFEDGHLDNIALQTAVERINTLIDETLAQYNEPVSIELMSMDTNGISGHIDHIVAGRASCLVFYRRKAVDPRFARLRLACVSVEQLPTINTDWLYMEPGRSEAEIGEVVDARAYHDRIVAVMRAHHTQRSDAEAHFTRRGDHLGLNSFLVLT
jgi:LmbE family N-acetylglucosaminyl deacetylase